MYSERVEQIIAALAALALAGFGALVGREGISQFWLIPLGALFVVLVTAQIIYHRRRSYLEVESYLELLLAQLAFPAGAGVRATYHEIRRDWRSLWRKRCFVQVLPYLPDRRSGRGRRFPVSKGMARKAYSQKRPVTERFDDDAQWRHAMLNDYNYTDEELRERAPDRRCYMAYPVIDHEQKVKALIWFDARDPSTLPPRGNRSTVKLVEVAVGRICSVVA